MSLAISTSQAVPDDADALALGVFEGLASPGRALEEAVAARLGFSGRLGETMVIAADGRRIEFAVGLGHPDRLDAEGLRRFGAAAARRADHAKVLAVDLSGVEAVGLDAGQVAEAVAQGAALASYRYVRFKTEAPSAALERVVLVHGGSGVQAGIDRALVVAEAVSLCRDLVNTPAGDLSPADFAAIATEVAQRTGLELTVLDEEAIAAEHLGGLLGVAAGSERPPRFVRLAYEPRRGAAAATVALVGKGITFDSGGLSIKPAASMMTMKTDMSGAAAVLATMSALGRLDVGVRVLGYLPLTDNMPGGGATRPGDVLRIRNGKTIEVLNTDAEGRLVLADALSLAVEERPDAIVDLATLTGACVVALGREIAGLLGNDDALLERVEAAGRRAGEALWQLPIPSGYRSHIDSEVADMKNIGATGQAGATAAALLLQEFVGDTPWAHLDIAGPARSEEDAGYRRKGGTGFGVRTLLELLAAYEPLGREAPGDAKGLAVLR